MKNFQFFGSPTARQVAVETVFDAGRNLQSVRPFPGEPNSLEARTGTHARPHGHQTGVARRGKYPVLDTACLYNSHHIVSGKTNSFFS